MNPLSHRKTQGLSPLLAVFFLVFIAGDTGATLIQFDVNFSCDDCVLYTGQSPGLPPTGSVFIDDSHVLSDGTTYLDAVSLSWNPNGKYEYTWTSVRGSTMALFESGQLVGIGWGPGTEFDREAWMRMGLATNGTWEIFPADVDPPYLDIVSGSYTISGPTVPEPTTATLLATGLILLGMRRASCRG